MVELKVRIGPKGQIVIPKIFRESYKMYPNQEVVVRAADGGVVIRSEGGAADKLRGFAEEARKKRGGNGFEYSKDEFYEQHGKRNKRAGL